MELIDSIIVGYRGFERTVALVIGDVAVMRDGEATDLLVVSAFPDDYLPVRGGVIGSLAAAGVSVADLARTKEVDLRSFSSCWLSRRLDRADIPFQRILCFEPASRGKAPELVGDIFRSLFPFTSGEAALRRIALPLVASGDQGEPRDVMLSALADASVHWLGAGLPVDRIDIVVHPRDDTAALRQRFAVVKARHVAATEPKPEPEFAFDFFVSYSHANKEAADVLVAELVQRKPGLRVFLDRLELQMGAAWQQKIFESLDQSRKVVCLLSPEYLSSKICQEEFNLGLLRHRDSEESVLLPLYLRTAALPTYMKAIQWEDVREADSAKLRWAAGRLVGE
jgi:hypothetical protein